MSESTSAIQSMLVENRVFPPSDATVKAARISGMSGYNALCAEAERDFEGFDGGARVAAIVDDDGEIIRPGASEAGFWRI
jgi:hypothetical protein